MIGVKPDVVIAVAGAVIYLVTKNTAVVKLFAGFTKVVFPASCIYFHNGCRLYAIRRLNQWSIVKFAQELYRRINQWVIVKFELGRLFSSNSVSPHSVIV